MDFRRIPNLPPYVFAEIDRLKLELRRAGEDVVDLGFGPPDLPSPPKSVVKLCEAAQLSRNHRYSASRGIPNLRRAICDRYARRYGVELDPETEAIVTMGAKEGFCHLFWVLVEPGDAVLVPSPSYPIHLFAPVFAGAAVTRVPVAPAGELLVALEEAFARAKPRPRVVCSRWRGGASGSSSATQPSSRRSPDSSPTSTTAPSSRSRSPPSPR